MQIFTYRHAFHTESGAVLPHIDIAYCTYGTLNADKSNVVWVCHALTASADAADWWPGVVGKDGVLDPEKYFIVCANILGSCYGSTGPLSINPETEKPYLHTFPLITIRDMVQAHMLLRAHLGIGRIHLLAGGSMGGYQALEWALAEPEHIERLFLLATSAAESAWGIAIHTAQRLAIEADATWQQDVPEAGAKGLKAARAIGMLTYRNYETFAAQQTDTDVNKLDHFKASSYIQYQSDKLVKRFNAYSYHLLTRSMDTHHIARGRTDQTAAALRMIQQPTLVIGISSDILCPSAEQAFIADHIMHCRHVLIDSPFGHDGFLVEAKQISAALAAWMTVF
jgi:homoserine O-acetyltransferase